VKTTLAFVLIRLLLPLETSTLAGVVKPGDEITSENSSTVQDLLSPGNYVLVKQGMRMKIVAHQPIEWPPPYKAATEKYSPQVRLKANGELENYTAGQPFPAIDVIDPKAALKVMWNFSFRPQYTDDVDLRYVEAASYKQGGGEPVAHFTIGHFAFYNNVGRTEVEPIPLDPEATSVGVRYRFAAYPFLEPAEIRGHGLLRLRYIDPTMIDNIWSYYPASRRIRHWVGIKESSDSVVGIEGTYASNLDPDSYFGFSAQIQHYDWKLLGMKAMLACVHAENSPAHPCPFDGNRSICPEAWEMRNVFIVEGTWRRPAPLPKLYTQVLEGGNSIPKRVLYIDAEGWFITASDQYDRDGKLWKTIATFNAYRDRPVPDARVAIYPYKRMFQTALVDENVQDGFSTVLSTPAPHSDERECWYINMGTVGRSFFTPDAMARSGH
jgi:hypothetical protein